MAERSESTPFLADTDHDDGDDYNPTNFSRVLPANAHFKKPLRVLSGVISCLSLGTFGLLIASYVLLNVGPFQYTWGSEEATRDLAIVTITNFILTTPSIFFQVPILINIAFSIAMSITLFVFSAAIFTYNAWLDDGACRRWSNVPYPGRPEELPVSGECLGAKDTIRIMMGISGGVGFLVALLVLTTLLLRVVALFRTKFWEGQKNLISVPKSFGSWNPSGFSVQFSVNLSILPNNPPAGAVQGEQTKASSAAGPSEGAEEGRLIET